MFSWNKIKKKIRYEEEIVKVDKVQIPNIVRKLIYFNTFDTISIHTRPKGMSFTNSRTSFTISQSLVNKSATI